MNVRASSSRSSQRAITFVSTTHLYVLIGVSFICLIAQGSATLSSNPAQIINGIVTVCRGEPVSLACTHSNTNSGNSRWIVGSPLNCAETVSSSVTPGQSCEPYVSFQDDSMLSEGVVSSIATVATDNTSVNGTVLECRDGAGLLYTSVGNVAICVVDSAQLPMPSQLSAVPTDNGLDLSWESVEFESCSFSFNIRILSMSGDVVRNLMTNTTSLSVEDLPSDEPYDISITTVVGSACASSSATMIFTIPGTGDRVQPWVIPVSVVVPVFVIIVIVLVIILLIAAVVLLADDRKELPASEYETLTVNRNCELNNFLQSEKKTYCSGCVYYEFTREKEDIVDKQIIFKDRGSGTLYTCSRLCERIGAPGSGIKRPNFKQYKVFVQSKGLGHRQVKRDTEIIYHTTTEPVEREQSTSFILRLTEEHRVPDPNKYKEIQCEEDIQLKAFIRKEKLTFTDDCAFIELGDTPEDIDQDKEVVIIKKDSPIDAPDHSAIEISQPPIAINPGDMFTGPVVKQMVGAPGRDITLPREIGEEWRVFVQSKHHGVRHIHKHTAILYKEPESSGLSPADPNRFKAYRVTIQCELKDFVEHQVDDQLTYNEPLRFFFQFTNDFEEITGDKEVILMDREGKLFTGSETIHKMIGAPGKHVNKPNLEEYTVFIQNCGSGKRSLDPDTTLLYDKTCQ